MQRVIKWGAVVHFLNKHFNCRLVYLFHNIVILFVTLITIQLQNKTTIYLDWTTH